MSTQAQTSTRKPSEVAREVFHAIFDERDLSDPSRYWTDESVDDFIALGKTVRGKDALAVFFRELFAAFPDWKLEIEQTIDDDDRRVVVQWSASATFDGVAWQGIEPTGSRVSVRGVDVITLDAGGAIAQNTVYYDAASFAARSACCRAKAHPVTGPCLRPSTSSRRPGRVCARAADDRRERARV